MTHPLLRSLISVASNLSAIRPPCTPPLTPSSTPPSTPHPLPSQLLLESDQPLDVNLTHALLLSLISVASDLSAAAAAIAAGGTPRAAPLHGGADSATT